MSSYRFCRTDDVSLLVDALNRCWSPYFPDEPAVTPATFKRSIRDLQVWCSSCMVAFSGSDPIGVLIGAKRSSATLIRTVAVHPDHCRQGHGRHLLTSLSSKLAILGPPRMVAEVPDTLLAARGLFLAAGYEQVAVLTDYSLEGPALSEPAFGEAGRRRVEGFVIPITVDDLAANGLLAEADAEAGKRWCWERSVETLTARKDEIAGLAVASDERIEAYVLYVERDAVSASARSATARPRRSSESEVGADAGRTEILSLRCFIEDGGARLKQLLSQLRARGMRSFWFPKVHSAEVSTELLETLGFCPSGGHLLYAARARSD